MKLFINLFEIRPSSEYMSLCYIRVFDRSGINSFAHKLSTEYDCIAAPHYSHYLGLNPGVYFICDEDETYKKLKDSRVDFSAIDVKATSYVVRSLLLKAIAKKIKSYAEKGKIYLTRRWFKYSQLSLYKPIPLVYSTPRRFFELREGLTIRVEHLIRGGEDKLFILADYEVRRINNLTIRKIIEALVEKGYNLESLKDLLVAHWYRCIIGDKSELCLLRDIKLDKDTVVVEIAGSLNEIPFDNVWLNPHPKHTRDFIINVLGENLSELEKIRIDRTKIRPKLRFGRISELIKELLIDVQVFPLTLGNVTYTLIPKPIEIIEEKMQVS